MPNHDFQVGEILDYIASPGYYHCLVTHISDNRITCDFTQPKGNYTGTHSFYYDSFQRYPTPPIPLTKEERVNNKCKLLWNKSKFVKKNKQFAY